MKAVECVIPYMGSRHERVCLNAFNGYFVNNCADVNECVEDTHSCDLNSTVCRNTNGSYECDCLPGYSRRTIFQCEGWLTCCDNRKVSCGEESEQINIHFLLVSYGILYLVQFLK